MAFNMVETITINGGQASTEYDQVMQAGEKGVNIAINGLTAGNVILQVYVLNEFVDFPNLTYNIDFYDYCRIHRGAMVRIKCDGDVTGDPVIQVYRR